MACYSKFAFQPGPRKWAGPEPFRYHPLLALSTRLWERHPDVVMVGGRVWSLAHQQQGSRPHRGEGRGGSGSSPMCWGTERAFPTGGSVCPTCPQRTQSFVQPGCRVPGEGICTSNLTCSAGAPLLSPPGNQAQLWPSLWPSFWVYSEPCLFLLITTKLHSRHSVRPRPLSSREPMLLLSIVLGCH